MNEIILHRMSKIVKSIPETDMRANLGPREFIIAFIMSLVHRTADKRSLQSIRLGVMGFLNKKISRSSFWYRISTNKMGDLLSSVIAELWRAATPPFCCMTVLLNHLGVVDILILDSTSCTLPQAAGDLFPAPRNNVVPAAVKLHCLFSLIKGKIFSYGISAGTLHDSNFFPIFKSLRKKLIIFDLGYWDYHLFIELKKHGAYFISRLKSNAIVKINKSNMGLPKIFCGQFLTSVKGRHGKIIDVMVTVGSESGHSFETRAIGFWNRSTSKYHWYITNLEVVAKFIYPLYRLRWQIELLFKACKSTFRMADITSANPKIIKNLILGNIALTLLTFPFMHIVEAGLPDENQIATTIQRAAKIMVNILKELFDVLSDECKLHLKILFDKIQLYKDELYDPNFNKRETAKGRLVKMTRVTMLKI